MSNHKNNKQKYKVNDDNFIKLLDDDDIIELLEDDLFEDEDLEIIIGDCTGSIHSSTSSYSKNAQHDDDEIILIKEITDQNKTSTKQIFDGKKPDVIFLGSESAENCLLSKSQTNIKLGDGLSEYHVIDPRLEVLDPTPNLQRLFEDFDRMFFEDRLVPFQKNLKVLKVGWCPRLTTSAGVFTVFKCHRTQQLQSHLKLSSKLLSLRPRSDMVHTLLHEMIHAYIYFTGIRDNGPHGHRFKELMRQINRIARTNITVYHTFHDEIHYIKNKNKKHNDTKENQQDYWSKLEASTKNPKTIGRAATNVQPPKTNSILNYFVRL